MHLTLPLIYDTFLEQEKLLYFDYNIILLHDKFSVLWEDGGNIRYHSGD